MAKSVLHVVPHEDTWAVKREGNERASSTHPTQKEAIDAARELAKELDDIVIHRPDGTIRERVTYFGSNGQAADEQGGGATQARAARSDAVGVEDVASVGKRVSWEAVLAGAVVAIASYVALSLLVLAIGLTAREWTSGNNFETAAGAVAGIILMVSLFLGGFVTSRATAGEQPHEGASYGVLVWGTVFILLLTGGLFGLGHLSGLRNMVPGAEATLRADAGVGAPSAERVQQQLGLTEQQTQHYRELTNAPATGVNPRNAAWWAFIGVAVSLLAAIAGGYFGAGPALALAVRRANGGAAVATTAATPAPRPA